MGGKPASLARARGQGHPNRERQAHPGREPPRQLEGADGLCSRCGFEAGAQRQAVQTEQEQRRHRRRCVTVTTKQKRRELLSTSVIISKMTLY